MVALTKDPATIFDHADVLTETTLRVFAFNNANLTGQILADRLINCALTIKHNAGEDRFGVFLHQRLLRRVVRGSVDTENQQSPQTGPFVEDKDNPPVISDLRRARQRLSLRRIPPDAVAWSSAAASSGSSDSPASMSDAADCN